MPIRIDEARIGGDRIYDVRDDRLRVRINADHGAHLFQIEDVPSGTELLHADPAGSRNYEVGGWYELFPNAGPECVFEGRPITRHGDIQHVPWQVEVEVDDGERAVLRLRAASRDLPLTIEKRIIVLASTGRIRVEARITHDASVGSDPIPYLWGQHITFGRPFLDGAEFHDVDGRFRGSARLAPDEGEMRERRGPLRAFPRGQSSIDLSRFPSANFDAMLFSERLQIGAARVRNTRVGVEAALSWDLNAYPYLWFWGTRSPDSEGLTACAIEPQACDVPSLTPAHAAGRAPLLEAGGSRTSWVELALSGVSSPAG